MIFPCLSSIEELRPALDRGVLVTLSDDWGGLFRFNNIAEKHEGYPHFRIRVGATDSSFNYPFFEKRGNDLLEKQKIVLVHELLHIFHFCTTGQGFTPLATRAFGSEEREREKAIDEGALRIVGQDAELFGAIVLELSANPKCSWKYEVTDTPFYRFHRDLVLSNLLAQAGRLQFGNPRQIKLLQLSREVQT